MKQQYEFAAMPYGVLSHTQAKVVGPELMKIEQKYGAIKPGDVVREAEQKGSSLHDYFTWDDKVAGQKYREDEARQIIRSIRIIKPEIKLSDQPVVRAIFSVDPHDKETSFQGTSYINFGRVMARKEYRDQVLATAHNELIEWERRYRHLLDFFGAEASIDTLKKGIEKKLKRRRKK